MGRRIWTSNRGHDASQSRRKITVQLDRGAWPDAIAWLTSKRSPSSGRSRRASRRGISDCAVRAAAAEHRCDSDSGTDAPSQHPRDGGADAVAVHTLLDQELDMELPRANITG